MKRSPFLLFVSFVFAALLVVFSPAGGAEVDRYIGVPEKCVKEENYLELSEAETRFCRDAVSQGLFRDFEEMRAEIRRARMIYDELIRVLEEKAKKKKTK